MKQIVLRKYLTDRASFVFRTSNINKVELGNLYNTYGSHVIGINNTLYVDRNLPVQFNVVTNDMEIPLRNLTGKKIINVPELNPSFSKTAPEFGLTIDNNVSYHQFNINTEDLLNIIGDSIFSFWDYDETLKVNTFSHTLENLNDYINSIKKFGYFAPVLLYIDNKVQTVHFPIAAYLAKEFNLPTVPVRVMTYVDYKYVENISPVLYAKIQNVPANLHYIKKDEIDYSPYFITNYSEKRDILTSMHFTPPVIPKEADEYPIDHFYPIFHFIFKDEYKSKNLDLLLSITSRKYAPMTHLPKLSISAEFYWRLIGKINIVRERINEEALDVIKKCTLDRIEEVDVDYAVPMFHINDYNINEIKEIDIALEKYGVDYLIINDDTNQFLGIEHIENNLDKPKVRIGYLYCEV